MVYRIDLDYVEGVGWVFMDDEMCEELCNQCVEFECWFVKCFDLCMGLLFFEEVV